MSEQTIIHLVITDMQARIIIPMLIGYHFLLVYIAPDIKKLFKLCYTKIKHIGKPKIGF